jgi:hypothetical protein
MKHYLSLGAGVQSSALALMATAGGFGPMPEAAIFADTGDEPASVYKWLDWLEAQLAFPVHRVTAGRGRLSDEATRLKLSGKSGNTYIPIGLPVFTVGENGKKGMGMRQCTRTFKIDPIRRKLRELANGEKVIQWIGISSDEVIRMKPSRDKWCENIWPLVDLGMTRKACLQWMKESGYPTPPRSACTYCPYHNDTEWLRLKTEEPEEFEAAVFFEKRLQKSYEESTALHSTPWLHSSRKPLSEVEFRPKEKELSLFGNECEGMCGV